MFRTILSSAALVVVPAVVVFAAGAQDKSKKTSHERLQPYWNQLELDERQREQYDRVAREFNPKIDKLEEELEALKERRRKAWLDILSSDQKKKLESLQASRGKKKPTDKEDKDGEETAKPKRGGKTTKPSKTEKKPESTDDPEANQNAEPKKGSKKKPAKSDDDSN